MYYRANYIISFSFCQWDLQIIFLSSYNRKGTTVSMFTFHTTSHRIAVVMVFSLPDNDRNLEVASSPTSSSKSQIHPQMPRFQSINLDNIRRSIRLIFNYPYLFSIQKLHNKRSTPFIICLQLFLKKYQKGA